GLARVPGIGSKTVARIKSPIERLQPERSKLRLNIATETGTAIAEALVASGAAPRVEIVGQTRRGCDMIDGIELLAAGDSVQVVEAFARLPLLSQVTNRTADRVDAITNMGYEITLHVAGEDDFGAAMIRTTGSAEHLKDLEAEAAAHGGSSLSFKLEPRQGGRARKKTEKASAAAAASEEEFYR